MLGIVILNYNCWDLNIKCIESIRRTTDIKYKIYLVDNCSTVQITDEFLNFLAVSHDVEFIQCNINKGYSAGNNVGYKRALEDGCGEILITNNDVIFSDGCLAGLQHLLQSNLKVAIAGPKIFLPNGKLQEINMGCKMTLGGKYLYLLRKTPLKKLSQKFVNEFHAYDKNKTTPFYVYGVSGCCFMISSYYSRDLYPLDENTFLYEEENIIAHKVDEMGKKIMYYTPSTIIHVGGESTKELSTFSYSCQVESEIYYCRRYLNSKIILLLPFILIRTIIYFKRYGLKDLKEYLRKVIMMLKKKIN